MKSSQFTKERYLFCDQFVSVIDLEFTHRLDAESRLTDWDYSAVAELDTTMIMATITNKITIMSIIALNSIMGNNQ